MKLIIDIPEADYKQIIGFGFLETTHGKMCYKAIKNGTPIPKDVSILSVTEFADRCRECGKRYVKIPDNATNGEVIKALFKPNWIRRMDDVVREEYEFDADWWNSPYQYQKGGKK